MRSGLIKIITGGRGSGKTALCRRLADEARASGSDVAGILSPAVFSAGQKVSIDAQDVRTGERRPLAWPREARDVGVTGTQTPGWQFCDATIAWADGVLAAAVPCQLLIVDELGPLELLHGEGWTAGMSALNTRNYGKALVVVRPELLRKAKDLWPDAEVVDVLLAPGTLPENSADLP